MATARATIDRRKCNLCDRTRILIGGTGVSICSHCDGWPPALDLPTAGTGQ